MRSHLLCKDRRVLTHGRIRRDFFEKCYPAIVFLSEGIQRLLRLSQLLVQSTVHTDVTLVLWTVPASRNSLLFLQVLPLRFQRGRLELRSFRPPRLAARPSLRVQIHICGHFHGDGGHELGRAGLRPIRA